MQKLERENIEKILLNMEEKELLPGEEVRLLKKDEKPCLLGTGGFSFVYEAYSAANPEKHYALKVAAFEDGTKALKDFTDSIEIQKMLQERCDNVVSILADGIFRAYLDDKGNIISATDYDDGRANEKASGQSDIVLALVLMEKLKSILENDRFSGVKLKRKELSNENGIILFARDISFALLKADELNILHRDIKLENIFYDAEKNIYKLGDFGNAKISEEAGTIIGTKGYEAPEIKNMLSDTYGEEADIYSFGVTIFLLMNGLKFPDSKAYHYSRAQYNEGYVFPQCSGFSGALNDIVRMMCAYEPKYRFSDIYRLYDIFSSFYSYEQERKLKKQEITPSAEANNGDETLRPVSGDETLRSVSRDETLPLASGDETLRSISGDETSSDNSKTGDMSYPSTIMDAIDVLKNNRSIRAEKMMARKIIKKDNQVQFAEDFIVAVILSFLSFEGFIPHSKPLPFWNIFLLSVIIISAAVFLHDRLKTASLALYGIGIGLLLFDIQNITRHLAFLYKIYDYHIGIVFAALYIFLIASYFDRMRFFSKLELKNNKDFSDNIGA